MSLVRQQAFISASPDVVWELISDVERHPEWWPRVLEVECDGLEEGCTYRELAKTPVGVDRMHLLVERLEDCRDLSIRCLNTGTFIQLLLTGAQGGTYVEAVAGMDPHGIGTRVFDAVAGRLYFRSWMRQTLEGLDGAARRREAVNEGRSDTAAR